MLTCSASNQPAMLVLLHPAHATWIRNDDREGFAFRRHFHTTGTDPSLVSRDMAPALWMAGAACHALLRGRPGRGLVLKQAPRDMCRVLGPGACQSQGQCQGAYMEDVYGVRVGRITSVSQGRCVCLSICAASFRHVIRVVLVAVLAHGLNMARRCHGARRLDVPPSLNVDGVPTHPGPASGCGWPRLCLSPSTVEGALGLPSSWKCQCPRSTTGARPATTS